MYLADFEDSPVISTKGYGGHRGRKIAVVYEGKPWMLKFPSRWSATPTSLDTERYAIWLQSPVCEYIGSKIYASLGIPTQEVMLGVREGQLVCACRDFTEGARLLDFSQIKNAADGDLLERGNGSHRGGELFSNVFRAIGTSEIFDGIREQMYERFWDMFVADTFLLNDSRSNEDWGLLVKPYLTEPAPVYDNGNALFNEHTAALMRATLFEPEELVDCLSLSYAFFADEWRCGEAEHGSCPFDLIERMDDYDCNMAVLRFAQRLDLEAVDAIIDGLPEEERGLTVMPRSTAVFYKRLLHGVAGKRILPFAQKIRERYQGGTSGNYAVEIIPSESGIGGDAEYDDLCDDFAVRPSVEFTTYKQADDYLSSLERRGVNARILMSGHPLMQ